MLEKQLHSTIHETCNHFEPYSATIATTHIDKLQSQVAYTKRVLGLSNEFSYYCKLLDYLNQHYHCEVRPLKNLYTPLPPDKFALSLRHDIDMDPFSAVSLSKALHMVGLSGSFYILHTANYYGRLIDKQFVRNGGMIDMLRTIQDDYHCELGLHVDGLWVYQQYGLDGAQAISTELAWLREQGLDIQGTVAHNSAPIYGAENFEIFEGRAVFNRFVLARNEQKIPLQSLNETAIGLNYEGNYVEVKNTQYTLALTRYLSNLPPDSVRNKQWMRTYLVENPYCRWGPDYNLWMVNIDNWAIGGHLSRDPLFVWDAHFDDVCQFLDQVPPGKHVVCHIHPIYVGWPDEQARAVSMPTTLRQEIQAVQEQLLTIEQAVQEQLLTIEQAVEDIKPFLTSLGWLGRLLNKRKK